MLPDEEYLTLKRNLTEENASLDELLRDWEKDYEDIFKTQEMVYNVHVWVSNY